MNENKKRIETVKDFQTSINLSYDLFNENKIKNFIPTKEAVKIFEQLLAGVFENNTNKARILTGAYGRGKSHIVLIFLSLLMKKNINIFKRLLEKIKIYNEDLYNFIFNYLKNDKKYFPIIVNGGNISLEQSFLLGLEEALKREDIFNIMPETNFESAIKTIENWKINYENTYKSFTVEIEEPVNLFIMDLKNYNLEKYRKFEKIYQKLTSGAVFNPFIGTQIIELYENINIKLKEKGYSGIYIVFDEFSKYLETGLNINSKRDIKLLQDFAEKCDRNKDINLLLITHKEFNNYLENNIFKEQIDSWKGISGRFLQMTMSNNFSEMYEIISTVIKKEEKFWRKFKEKNKGRFENLKNIIKKNNIVENFETENILTEGCYPLHPFTTFILPILSEKIAQNERSLFTFLSSNQKKSLNDFLKQEQNEFQLITPDYLYDYFEITLKNEIHTTSLYKNYNILKKVLAKVTPLSLEEKILKTLFLIYLVDKFETMPPTKEILIETYGYFYKDTAEIEKAIEILEKKECILYLKRSNNHLKIKETSGIDIQKEIEKNIDKIKVSNSYIDILNKLFINNYFYPNEYNLQKEMIRYFKFQFIGGKEFLNTRNWRKRVENENSDGMIFGIIYNTVEEKEKIKEYLMSENCINEQCIFIYLDEQTEIEKNIYEYYVASQLKELSQNDQVLQDEYEIIIDDLEKIISEYINYYIKPESRKGKYFYKGEKQYILRKSHFSELLTKICNDNFYLTPVINNEVINKNIISAITNKSRNKVMEKLLYGNFEHNLGFRGNGQEIFIFRTLLANTGVLINEEERVEINLENIKDKNLKYMLKIIEEKIKTSSLKQPLNLKKLYDILTSVDHHIGVRKGIIPVYLAVIFYIYREKLVIQRDNKDLKITADLLAEINENPDQYELYLENWDIKKLEYILNLEKIFKENINFSEKNYNNYKYITDGLRKWYIGLPKCSKEFLVYYKSMQFEEKSLNQEVIRFRESLKNNIKNSREYLFDTLTEIFNSSEFDLVLKKIKDAKEQLDNNLKDLEYFLISNLKNIFTKRENREINLISILKDWTDSLKESTKNYIFKKNENKFIELINNSNYDECEFIKKLGKIIASLRLEDWNEKTIETFLLEIKEIKNNIEKFDKKDRKEMKSVNNYKIIFTEEDGKENIKIFEKIEYSSRAKLLLNEIENSIDEMGYSITEEEKRQVLMEVLKKLC